MGCIQLPSSRLPQNPAVDETTVGREYLIYVDGGVTGTPNWILLGGQRSADRTKEAEAIDTSNKTSGGWKTSKPGLKSWSIDCETIMLRQDDGYAIVREAFEQQKDVHVKFEYPDKSYETGWGGVNSDSLSAPYDGAGEGSLTITGNGVLEPRRPVVHPIYTHFSKGAPADITFCLSPHSCMATSVKLDATDLTPTSDYTASSGQVVVHSSALADAVNGIHLILFTTNDEGITIVAHIVVED